MFVRMLFTVQTLWSKTSVAPSHVQRHNYPQYVDRDLRPGCHNLSGKGLLLFIRFWKIGVGWVSIQQLLPRPFNTIHVLTKGA